MAYTVPVNYTNLALLMCVVFFNRTFNFSEKKAIFVEKVAQMVTIQFCSKCFLI